MIKERRGGEGSRSHRRTRMAGRRRKRRRGRKNEEQKTFEDVDCDSEGPAHN